MTDSSCTLPVGNFHFHRPRRRRLVRLVSVALLVWIGCLAGCASQPTVIHYGAVYPRQGRARVYSVSPWLHEALVRIAQGRRVAWWDSNSLLFKNGRRTPTLEAKPGETIHFDGLDADGDLFLARAWIGAKPTVYNFSPHLPLISRDVTLHPPAATQPHPPRQSHVLPQVPR